MTKKVIKSLYGNTALLKGYCPDCKGYYFIKNGELQCCGNDIAIPDEEKIKRECDTSDQRCFTDKDKKMALEKQNGCCAYCGIDLKGYYWDKTKKEYRKIRIHYDHFRSWIYNQNSNKNNLIVSCHICNQIKGSKYFPTIDEARVYILLRREAKQID